MTSDRRPRRGLAVVALVLMHLPSALPAQTAPERRVTGLEFVGNEAFSDDQLAGAIVTRATRCKSFVFQFPLPFCPLTDWGFAHERHYLDQNELPADLLRLRLFYRRRGYREATVDTVVRRTNGEVRIRFRVEEGQPTRLGGVDIEGIRGVVGGEAVREALPLEPGDPFNLLALARGKKSIVDLLRDRGYPDAVVLDEYFIPTDARTADLTLRVRPGPRARIGRVQVEGGDGLDPGVVRQFLTFRSGDYYSQREIVESQRELYRLEAIRFADITTSRAAGADTLVDATVSVTPASRRSLRTGVGATTTECVQAEASFTHRNFLGSARRLRLTARLSNLLARDLAGRFPCTDVGTDPVFQDLNFSLGANFRQPFFLSGRNSLEAALFLERETIPDIFVRNSRGGELSLTRRLDPRMPLTLTFRPELTSFDERSADVFFCVNFGFCQPEDIDVLTDPRWLAPVILSWSIDRTDRAFAPTRGYYANLSLEGAEGVTGSDYQYLRFNVDAAAFESLTRGLVLAARFRSGFVESTGGRPFGDPEADVIHPRKRFFAGGAQSVRGFGQNLLGPRVLVLAAAPQCDPGQPLIRCARALADTAPGSLDERPIGGNAAFEANVELRARISSQWRFVGFVDFGQVWKDLGTFDAPVVSPGIGLRYSSPVGPLRLDVGYDPTDASRQPVVAELSSGELLKLGERVPFDPFTFDDPGSLTEFWRRLKFHISIGEAF